MKLITTLLLTFTVFTACDSAISDDKSLIKQSEPKTAVTINESVPDSKIIHAESTEMAIAEALYLLVPEPKKSRNPPVATTSEALGIANATKIFVLGVGKKVSAQDQENIKASAHITLTKNLDKSAAVIVEALKGIEAEKGTPCNVNELRVIRRILVDAGLKTPYSQVG